MKIEISSMTLMCNSCGYCMYWQEYSVNFVMESVFPVTFMEVTLLYYTVGFEVLTVVVMNVAIFWDSPYVCRRFGGTYDLHLQGRKSAEEETSRRQAARHNKLSAEVPRIVSSGR
jgi:hypothetical protein